MVIADAAGGPLSGDAIAELAMGMVLRAYVFDKYKTKGDKKDKAAKVTIHCADPAAAKKALSAATFGRRCATTGDDLYSKFDLPDFAGGNPISDGLATAAALLTADVGARLVVVSASGFDTDSGQAAVQAGLLTDLAQGLNGFQQTMDAADLGQDVLVVTTSEFGRRAAENASEGTDHGAGGLSFVLGNAVQGGLYGSADLGDLLDGDIRPVIDPRAMYTACLDWLGADVEAVLGRRYDGLSVLR